MPSPSSWTALIRLRPFLLPYRNRWAWAFAALIAVHVIEAAFPLLLKEGVNRIEARDYALGLPVGGILALTILRYAALSFGRRRNALISVDLASVLRLAVFSHLQKQGAGFFSRYSLGDLMVRATNDIEAIRQFFRGAVHQFVSIATILVVAPMFMVMQSTPLTLLLAATLAMLIGGSWVLANSIRNQSARAQSGFARLTDEVRRNLYGIHTIHSHAQEDREIERFASHSNAYASSNVKLVRGHALLNAFMSAAAGVIALVIIGVGGAQVLEGEISLGTLTAFIFYSGMILGVLSNSAGPAFLFLRASTACARLFEILDEKPELGDDADAIAAPAIRGAIAVDHLSFVYPNGAQALTGISLTIAPGEWIAVLGRVGSGKSTFLRLLARYLEPTGGAISLDGFNLLSFPLHRLRRDIALVTQDAFLFATSFAENISYDDPDRVEDLIWAAAHAASLEATVRRSPQGLATLIGERGITLSGGQKQRTNLARGLIRKTPVLLLDDCFSALDTETESQILGRVKALRFALTTILVSHRVSTARHADKIYFFDQGRVVESGSHDELQSVRGLYAALCRQQVGDRARTNEIEE